MNRIPALVVSVVAAGYAITDEYVSAATHAPGSWLTWQALTFVAALLLSLSASSWAIYRTVHPVTPTPRKIPDFGRIAALEFEIYGEMFPHEGAPAEVSGIVSQVTTLQEGVRQGMAVIAGLNGFVGDMKPGDVRWAVPWAVWADTDGRYWMPPHFTTRHERGGTAAMRIARRTDGYHVWLPADAPPMRVMSGNFSGGSLPVRMHDERESRDGSGPIYAG